MGAVEDYWSFCEELRIKNKHTISKRYASITRRLNNDFWKSDSTTLHSLYVGSYGRNTGIDGISDVDVLFKLPISLLARYKGHTGNGQSALLQAVRTSLATTYPNTSIGADGQVVVVTFGQGPKFEVLPAFGDKNGTFTHPDTRKGGTWQPTNPKAEIRAMRDADVRCSKNLRRLCRMMRVWKQEHDVPIKSFLIDTLAYQFIQTWPHRKQPFSHYDLMVRDFLAFTSEANPDQLYWKAPGSGRRALRTGKFETKAKRAYGVAIEAIRLESEGHPRHAHRARREIFGRRFG